MTTPDRIPAAALQDCMATGVSAETLSVATAIMNARVRFGWTFGKRPKVMAIDIVMAEAAVSALDMHRENAPYPCPEIDQ